MIRKTLAYPPLFLLISCLFSVFSLCVSVLMPVFFRDPSVFVFFAVSVCISLGSDCGCCVWLLQLAVVRQVLRKELGLKIVEVDTEKAIIEGGDVLWTGSNQFQMIV